MSKGITEIKVEWNMNLRDVLSILPKDAYRMEALVEKGKVYKHDCGQSSQDSVSILFLEPRAKIGIHMHFDDSEKYIVLNENTYECPKGHGHSLENTSKTAWLVVISVKSK